jgi:homoserine dehydrogenase
VYREGITGVTLDQVVAARKAGYVVKLLAICERLRDANGVDGISARVYPALVPDTHPLAAVHGANNAVFVEAESAGPLMFYGAGAGGIQTASAVLGDVVSAARRHVVGGPGVAESTHADLPVHPISAITTRYQITVEVRDEPGVLAAIAALFHEHGVSVETLEQSVPELDPGSEGSAAAATLVIGTHRAAEADLAATVAALTSSSVVHSVTSVLRVEGLS